MNCTPGTWKANDYWTDLKDHRVIYVHQMTGEIYGSEIIAQCWQTGCDRGLSELEQIEETEANARLIAAAPELYRACQAAMAYLAYPTPSKFIENRKAATELLVAALSKVERKEGGETT